MARTPSPSDGRVPCPQCGGFVHPIAGRCKHCKADLAVQRSARPAAMAALPALRHGKEAPAPGPAPSPYSAPEPVRPPVVAAVPASHAADEARPILPPRPTGRMEASAPRRSLLRNWPVIVIVLASLAIATAVVLMIYPPAGTAKADTRRLAPPPAPERMDTNPLPPKSSSIDPWSKGNPQGAQPAPSAPPPDDTDDDQIDPDDLAVDPFNPNGGGSAPSDPFGGLTNPLGANPFANLGNLQGQFMFTMLDHACGRAKTCGNSQMASMCSTLDMFPKGAKAPSCAAGQRCLDKIDQLDCAALAGDDLLGAVGLAQECMEAFTAC